MERCPQCNSIKSWHFVEGEPADSIWDRFDKVSPDQGECWKCGFRYSEHIDHPLEEQIKQFRAKRTKKSYTLYLKSHCESPDYESTIEAKDKEEAIKEFLKDPALREWDRDMIKDEIGT